MINLSAESNDPLDYFEHDTTINLVETHYTHQKGGLTIVKPSVTYEKNTNLVTVMFIDSSYDTAQESVVITFSRKAQNQKNLEKLQENK